MGRVKGLTKKYILQHKQRLGRGQIVQIIFTRFMDDPSKFQNTFIIRNKQKSISVIHTILTAKYTQLKHGAKLRVIESERILRKLLLGRSIHF